MCFEKNFADPFRCLYCSGLCLAVTTTNGLDAKKKARELETECFNDATSQVRGRDTVRLCYT
jgi:hypothetical protein